MLEPVLQGDELLDAVMMGQKAEQLVRAGDQYIAIDLTKLDYIYSDSINRFINLNRAILDINGRIVIVAPHPKVYELLEKAGVLNFIKVCRSTEELLRISEMIAPTMEQQAPIQPQQPMAQAPVQPQQPMAQAPVQPQQPMVQAPVQPQQPMAQAPVQPQQPVQPEPVFEEPQVVTTEATLPEPEVSTESDSAFESAFEAASGPSSKAVSADEAPLDDLFDDDDEPKKSKAPIVVVVLLLIAAIVGGVFYAISQGGKTAKPAAETKPVVTTPVETVKEEAPVEKDIDEPLVEEKKEPVKKVTSTSKKTTRKTTSKKSTPKKVAGDAITITTTPTGVDVIANGDFVGTTPYTWANPKAYGDIEFKFRKRGYAELVKHVEYLGGKESVSATLAREGSTPATSAVTNTANTANDAAKLKAAEEARLAADKAEAQRKADEARIAAEKADATRKAEEARLAADAAAKLKAAEDARLAAEKADALKKAEQQRLAAENARKAEEARKAEIARKEEEARKVEIARKEEEARKAEEARKKAEAERAANAEATIYFNSLPPMADVYENGTLVGKTNVKPIVTKPGAHTYTFKKGAMTATFSVTLREGKNSAPMIRLK